MPMNKLGKHTVEVPSRICIFISAVFFFLCAVGANSTASEGKLIKTFVHSTSLEGNLLGDTPDRSVIIYLPPSYDFLTSRAYPVVFLLHGYDGHSDWLISSKYSIGGGNIKDSMDEWIKQGRIREMILVMPDANNRFGGSMYANSPVTGNWSDFIAIDLVKYLDANFRTLPHPNYRAIFGHSMGAFAINIGMLYPDVFSNVGGIGGTYDFEILLNDEIIQFIVALAESYDGSMHIESFDKLLRWIVAIGSAFSPAPDKPPFYVDFPFVFSETDKDQIIKINEAYEKLISYSPVRMVDRYQEALKRMKVIYIACGSNDMWLEHSRRLHDKLLELGISHVYDEFEGGHNSHVLVKIGEALELFSDSLDREVKTQVERDYKLHISWGKLKLSY